MNTEDIDGDQLCEESKIDVFFEWVKNYLKYKITKSFKMPMCPRWLPLQV